MFKTHHVKSTPVRINFSKDEEKNINYKKCVLVDTYIVRKLMQDFCEEKWRKSGHLNA